MSCAGPYLVLRCLVWCVWGHEVVCSWKGWFWCSFWVVWGVFTDKHVDANCRTVNLLGFFFKLPYFGLVNCRTQSVFCFWYYISQIKTITTKTYTERDFQYAHYFGIENEGENGFKQCRNKHFAMGHAVFSGTLYQPAVFRDGLWHTARIGHFGGHGWVFDFSKDEFYSLRGQAVITNH